MTDRDQLQIVAVEEPPVDLAAKATALLPTTEPTFKSRRGAAYTGDAIELLKALPDESVSLVVTSPPYALEFKKEYGNEPQDKYVEWFVPFAEQIKRVLRADGSFVVNVAGAWQKSQPVRSLYHFKRLHGGRVGGVAGKGLDRDRAAPTVGEEAELDLRAVGAMVARVAVAGEGGSHRCCGPARLLPVSQWYPHVVMSHRLRQSPSGWHPGTPRPKCPSRLWC